ncbi:MAG: SIS domain-containing protein [Phycisphaerae bacterium]|nr:SIS domain-containing protein [Phycisphaerae bacterium]
MSLWKQTTTETLDLCSRLEPLGGPIDQAAQTIAQTLQAGRTVFACGNGGSASQAAHFCGELVGRYRANREPLAAVCLSSDGPLLTCLINDYDAVDVFARQVRALVRPGDCVVGLSTSGASQNVARALLAARERGARTIALLGRSGSPDSAKPVFGLADAEIVVPDSRTARIQEVHLMIIHTWCEHLDEVFASGKQTG